MPGGWSKYLVVTPRTRSMKVTLVAENLAGAGPFEVRFDNVLVKER